MRGGAWRGRAGRSAAALRASAVVKARWSPSRPERGGRRAVASAAVPRPWAFSAALSPRGAPEAPPRIPPGSAHACSASRARSGGHHVPLSAAEAPGTKSVPGALSRPGWLRSPQGPLPPTRTPRRPTTVELTGPRRGLRERVFRLGGLGAGHLVGGWGAGRSPRVRPRGGGWGCRAWGGGLRPRGVGVWGREEPHTEPRRTVRPKATTEGARGTAHRATRSSANQGHG